MKIGIIGGSLAGCSAAYLLMKAGYDVAVFERSNKALVGRGGGIGTTTGVIEQIKQEGMLADDFNAFVVENMPLVGKSDESEPYGKTAWSIPLNFEVFQWNELWKKLRRNIPDDRFVAGVKITSAEMKDLNTVVLSSEKGTRFEFNLVLFADGYNSLGRSIIFPEKHLKYRGYVLWRGLLPEYEMKSPSPSEHSILRLSYQGHPGHNVVYYIPNSNGSVKTGERIFNWAAYIALSEEELEEVMRDKNDNVRYGTLPPGSMSEKTETRLKLFLEEKIPGYYAEMVNKTQDSYIQVIYTLELESYYKNRMCLIGDAGMVIQPFTGSGVFKGYNNAKDLIECLRSESTMEKALEIWSDKQVMTGKRLLALGEQMESAFIWKQLDFARATEEETKKWWNESVTFPENFSYAKSTK